MNALSALCLRLVQRYGTVGLGTAVVGSTVIMGPGGTLLGLILADVPRHLWPAAMIIAVVIGGVCSITVASPIITMANGLSHALRDLEAASRTDLVTNLLTRRAFLDAAAAHDHADRVAAVMVDVDHFKTVNDDFGHAAGDDVLRRIGDVLASSLPTALVGRIGGDEFAACATDCDAGMLERTLATALSAIATPGARTTSCTYGVAMKRPGETFDECLHRADLGLLERKRQRTPSTASTPDTPGTLGTTLFTTSGIGR